MIVSKTQSLSSVDHSTYARERSKIEKYLKKQFLLALLSNPRGPTNPFSAF